LFSSVTAVSAFSSDVGVSVLVSSEVGVSVFSDFSLSSSLGLGVVSVFSDFSLFSSEGVVSVFSLRSDYYSSWDSCSSFDTGVLWLSSAGFSVFSECSSDYVGVSSCFYSSCSAFSVGLLCSLSVSVGTYSCSYSFRNSCSWFSLVYSCSLGWCSYSDGYSYS